MALHREREGVVRSLKPQSNGDAVGAHSGLPTAAAGDGLARFRGPLTWFGGETRKHIWFTTGLRWKAGALARELTTGRRGTGI